MMFLVQVRFILYPFTACIYTEMTKTQTKMATMYKKNRFQNAVFLVYIENAILHDVTQYGGNIKSDGCLDFIQSTVNLDLSPPTKLLIAVHHFYLLSDEEENILCYTFRKKPCDSL